MWVHWHLPAPVFPSSFLRWMNASVFILESRESIELIIVTDGDGCDDDSDIWWWFFFIFLVVFLVVRRFLDGSVVVVEVQVVQVKNRGDMHDHC